MTPEQRREVLVRVDALIDRMREEAKPEPGENIDLEDAIELHLVELAVAGIGALVDIAEHLGTIARRQYGTPDLGR